MAEHWQSGDADQALTPRWLGPPAGETLDRNHSTGIRARAGAPPAHGLGAQHERAVHQFTANPDSLVCTRVIPCSDVSVTGPGSIYRVRFTARADAVRLTPLDSLGRRVAASRRACLIFSS